MRDSEVSEIKKENINVKEENNELIEVNTKLSHDLESLKKFIDVINEKNNEVIKFINYLFIIILLYSYLKI